MLHFYTRGEFDKVINNCKCFVLKSFSSTLKFDCIGVKQALGSTCILTVFGLCSHDGVLLCFEWVQVMPGSDDSSRKRKEKRSFITVAHC